jgi:hypothetical protein
MGGVVPAQAGDGTFGDPSPIIFYDVTPQNFYHEDTAPWKGFFMIYSQNSTGTAWSGFNFTVSGSDAVFIDTDLWDTSHSSPNLCVDWAFDGDCDPHAATNIGIDIWNISENQKSMSVTLSNNWDAGQTAWIRVYTDNTATQGNFTVSVAPVLVPEPISSALFIVGGATLGFRRFRKKFIK